MLNLGVAIRALAGDLHAVAAHRSRCLVQRGIVCIVVDVRPFLDAVEAWREVHRAAGVGIELLFVERHLVAHVRGSDLHGHGAFHGLVVLLFQREVDDVVADVGERGHVFAVRALVGRGVAHFHIRYADIHADRVGLTVVFDAERIRAIEAADAVCNRRL